MTIEGTFFFAGMSKLGIRVESAEVAEFVVAREALSFAIEAGFRDITLEGDNDAVISAISTEENGVSTGGVIVDNVGILKSLCNHFVFSFTKRGQFHRSFLC